MKEPDLLQHLDGHHVRWRGRTLLYFAGCDYHRMSRHPAVLKAASIGLGKLGLNVAASRLTTGQHPIYEKLEARLARFFRAPDALLVPTGYLTSTVVAQAVAGEFGPVLMDEASHPALQDAALHFGCRVRMFRHRDPHDLRRQMRRFGSAKRVALLTDGMFARDGSVAPLRDYLAALPSRALLLVDDAHGAGVLGARGRGTPEHEGVSRDRRLVQCVTLSKAFGVHGGAVLGSRALRKRILARSRAFLGCTPLPPPLANAALSSVAVLARGRSRLQRLHRNADHVKQALRRAGLALADHPGPIVPLHPTNKAETRRLAQHLFQTGIYPSFLEYAGMREGCFRFVISSEHTRAQLDQLISALTGFTAAGRSGAGKEAGPTRRKAAQR